MELRARRIALKVALVYVVVAACWILFSDVLLATFVRNPDQRELLSVAKGWLFVLFTGLLLYLLLNRWLGKWEHEAGQRREAEIARETVTEKLLKSEEQLRLVIQASADGLWDWNIKSGATYLSPRYGEITGEPSENVPSGLQFLESLVHPQDWPALKESINTHLNGKSDQSSDEFRIITKDDQTRWIWGRGRVVEHAPDGAPLRMVGTISDITRRKQAEESWRESEERYKALFDRSTECVFLCDFDGYFLDANQAALDLLGYQRTDIPQLNFVSLLTEEQLPVALQLIEVIKQHGHQPLPAEFKLRTRDGKIVFVETQGTLLNRDGKPFAIQGIAHDVTARKLAEQALLETTAQLTQAQRIAGIGSFSLEIPSGQWTSSEMLDDIFGIAEPAFKKDWGGWMQVIHPFDRSEVRQHLESTLASQGDFDRNYRITRINNQQERWVHCLGKLIRDKQGRSVQLVGTIQDITERKKSEEWSMRLATAVEQSFETIVITDIYGTILYANPAFEISTGYTRAEALGKNPRMLKGGKHDAEFYTQMWDTLQRGKVWKGHFTNRRKDGILYEEEATITPVRDEAGKIVNFVAVKRDVTRELQLEAQFREAQKMDAIGTLAGGIAHDFNNILTAMFGYCYLLRHDVDGNFEAMDKVEEILSSAMRAKDLVQQILTFSRKSEQKRQIIQLNAVINEVTKFLRASLPANIKINLDLAADSPTVLADPTQIYQVTMNLATNALHAMEGKNGELSIRLQPFEPDENLIASRPEFQQGRYTRLTVADTGHGMDGKTLERIFEPFFTTKPAGQGTGLGLSVVHGVVKAHDGIITVNSAPGEGTTFRLYFPERTQMEMPIEEPLAKAATGQGERILLVDDEVPLTSVFRMLLKLLNYQATVHTDAREALKEFNKDPQRFDLVITDYTMPEMNGIELARQIRNLRPDLPVILLTGVGSSLNKRQIAEAGICEMMEKPVSMTVLADTLQRNLP